MSAAAATAPALCPFAVGERSTKEVYLDAASIRTFATLAGDHNPLHHDDAAAAAGPFGALIASGTQVLALLLGLDATFLSARGEALGLEFSFRFVKAVRAGTQLTFSWTISAIAYKPSLAGHVVSMDGTVHGSDGTLYLSAQGSNLLRPLRRVMA